MSQTLTNDLIELFMENDILLSPDVVERIKKLNSIEEANFLLEELKNNDETIATSDYIEEKKEKSDPLNTYQSSVKVLFDYSKESHKRTVEHFVSYFRSRFKAIQRILQNRKELNGTTSISRLLNKREKEAVALIGMVSDINETKNNHIMLTVEDLTGQIKVLINRNRPDLLEEAKLIVKDEIIGIVGTINDKMVFANNFYFPDIPLTKELKKSPVEEYAAFIGDPHFGAKVFLKKEFEKFIKWLNCETGGDEQKKIASKLRYLFIVGDLVEGIGIYPSQEADLEVTDIYQQYQIFADYLKQVPEYIQIIICPGNHDAIRIGEPQPKLYSDLAAPIYALKNTHMVSNPALVNVGATNDFEGIDVLLYHGYSFPFFAENIEPIRTAGGQKRADLIMKLLLRKRHLAPTHTSNLYIPDPESDPLVIDKIPDIFVTGHIHRSTVTNYKNITLLNCSCWLSATPYQEKIGLVPQPGRLPIVNLQTREVKLINFAPHISGD